MDLKLTDKVAVVTGANKGIGFAVTEALVAEGALVVAGSRSTENLDGLDRVIAMPVDLAAPDGPGSLVQRAIDEHGRLDVLVNNVGGYWDSRHVTADGLEHTFALNHLAPFLLTNLLIDRLKQGAPARVVTVSSGAHSQGQMDFDDLQGERSYSGQRAYNQSKLANVLFTYELARLLQGSAVTANVLHPGVVRTSFGAEDPGRVQRLFVPFLRPFMKDPAQGAAPSIHVASSPHLEQVTGQYFVNSKPRRSSERSYDEATAARLWQVSADLVGLTEAGGSLI